MDEGFGFDDLLEVLTGPEGDVTDGAEEPEAVLEPPTGDGTDSSPSEDDDAADDEAADDEDTAEGLSIPTPPELSGPNADQALDAMRMEHDSIMNALRNIS